MVTLLQYPAADIRTEGIAVNADLPSPWLRRALAASEVEPRDEVPATVRGRLSRSGHDIVVRLRVRAGVKLPCARCLEEAAVDVDTELSLLLEPAAAARAHNRAGGRHSHGGSNGSARRGDPAEEYEFSSAEADVDVYDGETVVLDDFVREAILLEVPTFPLCREECPGLAPLALEIEAAKTVDPRLAPLSAFRRDDDGPVTLDQLVAAASKRSEAMGRKPMLKTHRHKRKKKKKK
ncbi:MAG: DUF177 domain-containing protein [Myxococcota bacterium]